MRDLQCKNLQNDSQPKQGRKKQKTGFTIWFKDLF